MQTDHSLLAHHLPVFDVVETIASQVVLIVKRTVAVVEIRTQHRGVEADAAVEHHIAHFGRVFQNVVNIVIDAVRTVLNRQS